MDNHVPVSAKSIIQPLRPLWPDWSGPFPVDPRVSMGYAATSFLHEKERIFVISAVEVAADKDGIDRGPEYHISISKRSVAGACRCSAAEAMWVLHQFGLDGAEEDNHVPGGVARNFWRTVADALVGLECACKEAEQAVVDGDYVWRA